METLIALALHPSELAAVASHTFRQIFPVDTIRHDRNTTTATTGTVADEDRDSAALRQCYTFLDMTSRSFAAVVRGLDVELRDPIAIFYLVLRGLDTVEDDMSIDLAVKVPELRAFHEKLYQPGWQFHQNAPTEKDAPLLRNFDVVIDRFLALKPCYQVVIADICLKMGAGMADFAAQQRIGSKRDWDLYCHYVAGLVGVGLCRMFAASGLEDAKVATVDHLANSMGLFLQKVNIIRDYLEDLRDGRTFYPEEIWSQYATELGDFTNENNKEAALACLNHLILDTLQLIPDCLEFMSLLHDPTVFRFCAIPQVMAIATLSLCFDNYRVFQTTVKIRKGLALKLMAHTSDMTAVLAVFEQFCGDIAGRLWCGEDRHALEISLALGRVDAWIASHSQLA